MELRHGTYQYGYRLGCREQCCRRAYNRWSSNRYNLRRRQGAVVEWTTPDEVSERISLLIREYNHTLRTLSDTTGLAKDSIYNWYAKRSKRIRKAKVQKIFDVPLKPRVEATSKWSRIPAVGTVRRIQDLYRRGYTETAIAQLAPMDQKLVHRLRTGQVQRVEKHTHDKVVSLSNNALLMPEPSGVQASRARRIAREEGFHPIGVWADVDDPECEPESNGEQAQVDGKTFDADLARAILRARALSVRGFQAKDVADEAGINRSSFAKIIYGDRPNTSPENVKKILAACDHFEPLPDPQGPLAQKTSTTALNRGWDKETVRIK